MRSLRDFLRPGVTHSLAELASQPEGMANEHVGVKARAARINPPSAVDGDNISP